MAEEILSKLEANKSSISYCSGLIMNLCESILNSAEDPMSICRILPNFISRLFGNSDYVGWLDEAKSRDDRASLIRLMATNGALFRVLLSLRGDPKLKYQLVLDNLPIHFKNAIIEKEWQALPVMIQKRLIYNNIGAEEAKSTTSGGNTSHVSGCVMLDIMEFYLFCFVHHMVLVDHDNAAETESLYQSIFRSYLQFFFPTTNSNSPMIFDFPSFMDISSFFADVLTILWLEQNSYCLSLDNFTPTSKSNYRCSNFMLLKSVNILVSHVATFDFQNIYALNKNLQMMSPMGLSKAPYGSLYSYKMERSFTEMVGSLQLTLYKSIQKPLYCFLRLAMTFCPNDYRIFLISDIWTTFSFPWMQFIIDNFLFYHALMYSYLIRSLQQIESLASSVSASAIEIQSVLLIVQNLSAVMTIISCNNVLASIIDNVENSIGYQEEISSVQPLRRERRKSMSPQREMAESPRKKDEIINRLANQVVSMNLHHILQEISHFEPVGFRMEFFFEEGLVTDTVIRIIGLLHMFVNNVKEQGKNASQSDFFSFLSSNNTESDEVSKTLEGKIDSLCSLLLRFFKLNNADLEAMIGSMPELASIKERGLNQSILAEVDSNEALTERGRYQIRSGARKFDPTGVKAINKADELIILTYENPFLAQKLYQLSVIVEEKLQGIVDQINDAQNIFQIPVSFRRNLRINFRFIASYLNMLRVFICISFALLILRLFRII